MSRLMIHLQRRRATLELGYIQTSHTAQFCAEAMPAADGQEVALCTYEQYQ